MAAGPGTVLDRATDPSVVAADLRRREGTGSVRDGCNGGASINQLNQIVLVSQSVKNGRRWQLYFSSLLIAKGWKANQTGTEKSGRNPHTKIQSKKQRRGSDGREAGREEAIAGGALAVAVPCRGTPLRCAQGAGSLDGRDEERGRERERGEEREEGRSRAAAACHSLERERGRSTILRVTTTVVELSSTKQTRSNGMYARVLAYVPPTS